MEYTQLGKTGLQVSSIALGGMNFGRLEKNTAFAILDKAHDLGINLIDTASGYGPSETIIGEWMAKAGNRDEVVINTKVGWPTGQGKHDRGLSRLHITRQLEKSLVALQSDYIDIYQAHYYDGHENLYGLVRLFHELAESGEVRSIGAPLFMRSYNMVAWHYLAQQYGLNSIGSKLLTTSLLSRGMYNGDTRHIAKDYDIGLITFGTLGGGLLTGKYHSKIPYPEGGKEMLRKTVEEGKADAVVDAVTEMAKELDTTVAKLSFAWVLHHDFMDSAVIGASTPDQLEDILSAREIKLSEDQFTQLKEVSDKHYIW